jgi:hypothetical protein
MTKRKTLQARPGARGASKKTHSRSNETKDPAKAASQTRQPYEQDPKEVRPPRQYDFQAETCREYKEKKYAAEKGKT